MRPLVAVDFETEKIGPRPKEYPPKPVGLALHGDSVPSQYLAWGHSSANNTTLSAAKVKLRQLYQTHRVIFHNSKFDVEVALKHFGLRVPSPDDYEDTLFLAFLHNPRSEDLGLKSVATKVLGIPPKERDRLKEWILENISEATEKTWGAFISQAPGQLVAPYAIGDVTRTYKLFKKLYKYVNDNNMLEAYRREKRLMPVLLKMESRGVRINQRRLEKDVIGWRKQAESLERYIIKRLGGQRAVAHLGGKAGFNVGSSKQLAEALEQSGLVGELPLTKKGHKSTKRDVLQEAITDPKITEAIAKRVILLKYLSTYADKWLESESGIVYPSINQVRNNETNEARTTGARTGRLSYSDSWQAIPKPERRPYSDLPNLRTYILPDEPKRQVINHRDYSQQEFRILAHYENGPLLARYQADPHIDMHDTATAMINALTGMRFERRPVKDIGFGLIYGMGIEKTAKKTGQDLATTKMLRRSYLKAIPGFEALQAEIKSRCKAGEPIRTWGGRLYWVEEPKYVEKFNQVISFEYKMINVLVQGSAGDCTKEAMIRTDEAFSALGDDIVRMLISVHDEINTGVDKTQRHRAMQLQKEAMESIEFDVLMTSDGKWGLNWGELKKYND